MLYILTGSNSYAKRLRVAELVGGKTDIIQLEAAQGLSRWFEVVGQSDLFGEMPLVIGRDQLDEWPAEDKRRWREHLEQAKVDKSLVILLSRKAVDETKSELAEWRQAGALIEYFEPLNQARMMQWVRQQAGEKGLVIESRVLGDVVQSFKGDQQAAVQQIEVWSLQGLKTIGSEQLLEIGSVGESSVFALTESWVRRRLAESMGHLHDLLSASADTKQIIGMLGWQIEQMRASQVLNALDIKIGAAQSKAFTSNNLQKAGRLAALWTEEELMMASNGLIELDLGSRNGEVKDVVLGLELWLLKTSVRRPA